jgi:Ca2+-transporting ATPase
VETLGCATVICSDKTGTLTRNEMTVKAVLAGRNLYSVSGAGYEPKGEFLLGDGKIDVKDHADLKKALECGVLCNGSELTRDGEGYKIFGDPTEASILTAAAKAGILKKNLESEFSFLEEIPFDPNRKKMTIVRRSKDGTIAFVKGAPDVLLKDCVNIEEDGNPRRLDAPDRERILKTNNELASRALRVLGLAYRRLDKTTDEYSASGIERDLTFTGLIAMIDPPREEVKSAIARCEAAGIKTVMITGDHKNTAVAIAEELGFYRAGSVSLTGEELDRIGDEEFYGKAEDIAVYARVSPEHKLRIVRAWRSRKEVVAMTGDGVNDAPAVKEADIGVAMGITGTDVTKEVSDMVVTDDNFASIVAAVEEGRGIYDNIRKFIHYLLSCNAGEILVMFAASLVGLPSPLLPVQILWVNLVTDGLPALALGMDPVAADIMARPPRPSDEAVVTKTNAYIMLAQGAFIAACSLSAFLFVVFVENGTLARARTAAFFVLSVSQLFHSFNCRSNTESLFKIGLLTNKKLIAAVLVSALLQLSVLYIPIFSRIFQTEALGALDIIFVILISSFPLWAMETVKMMIKKRRAA